jgi:hypothetical protein
MSQAPRPQAPGWNRLTCMKLSGMEQTYMHENTHKAATLDPDAFLRVQLNIRQRISVGAASRACVRSLTRGVGCPTESAKLLHSLSTCSADKTWTKPRYQSVVARAVLAAADPSPPRRFFGAARKSDFMMIDCMLPSVLVGKCLQSVAAVPSLLLHAAI